MTYTRDIVINDIIINQDVNVAVDRLQNSPRIAIDLETGGLQPYKGQPIAVVQLYDETDTAHILHVRGNIRKHERLCRLLEDPTKTFAGHNIYSFDLKWLLHAGIDIDGPTWYDTLVRETMVTGTGRAHVSKSLKAAAERRLGVDLKKETGSDHNGWMNPFLTEQQLKYCLEDVSMIWPLFRAQQDKLEKSEQTEADALERDIGPMYARMGYNGLPVDLERLDEYLQRLTHQRDEAEVRMHRSIGTLNLGSPKQVKEAFAKVGVTLMSTGVEVMEQLAAEPGPGQELAKIIMDFRHADKRVNVYSIMMSRFGHDNRVYGNVRQLGADTGRSTSSDPNLQQIPADMRDVFGGVPGYTVVKIDLKAIEAYVAAKLAGDTAMLDAYSHEDLHTITASLLYKCPKSAVSKEMRQVAKAATFTLTFCGGARRFWEYARGLGSSLTLEEARSAMRDYFHAFPGLAKMRSQAYGMTDAYNRAVASGRHPAPIIIRLPHGLQRVLVGDKISPTVVVNSSVQGTAAGGLKKGLLLMKPYKLHHWLVAIVHDEVVFCCPDSMAESLEATARECLIRGFELLIGADPPIQLEAKRGTHWSK